MIEILKVVFLFFVAWQLPIIVIRAARKLAVVWTSFVVLAIGITGFVYLQFLM